ncbi:unnamed protein product [Trichobilharzia szidati]|nr:unnamed protein product [Trichobilharzia szidati]
MTALLIIRHRTRRAFLKKLKRKRKRQRLAQENEEKELQELSRLQLSPTYQAQQAKELELAALEAAEHERNEQKWLQREKEAQLKWEEDCRHRKLLKEREEEAQKRIREEWESKQLETKNIVCASKSQAIHEQSSNLPPWHHPPPPVSITSVVEQVPRSSISTVIEKCSFFRKTGACRYDFLCSRLHEYPSAYDTTASFNLINDDQDGFDEPIDNSCLVLRIPKMFTHFHLDLTRKVGSEDQDSGLEVDENQLLSDYHEFYHDVRSEMESRWGKISVIRTCRNLADHLCGTVYIEFARGPSATWDAAEACNGRWFAGRQLTCSVVRLGGGWREAICGLYHRGKCPKGDLHCNFLHVFLNPGETVNDIQKALWRHLGRLPSPVDNTHCDRVSYSPVTKSHRKRSSHSNHHRRHKKRRRSSRTPSPSASSSSSSSSPTSRRTRRKRRDYSSRSKDNCKRSSPSADHHRHKRSRHSDNVTQSRSPSHRHSPSPTMHRKRKKHTRDRSPHCTNRITDQ